MLKNAAIKQGWRDGGIYNIKAVALTQLQQYDAAMDAINMAINLDPDNRKFAKNKGIIEAKKINTSPPKSNIDPTTHQKERPTDQNGAISTLFGGIGLLFVLVFVLLLIPLLILWAGKFLENLYSCA